VRPLRPANKVFIPLFVVGVALLATWISRRDGGDSPPEAARTPPKVEVGFITEPDRASKTTTAGRKAPFDFYLLALTWHPAFCADGRSREPECRADSVPLSIHGLWPEKLESGKYPRDCAGPPLDLDRSFATQLAAYMPGMADGLHEHEWRKHGTCTGLDDDVYFGHTLHYATRVGSALSARLTTLAGRSTTAAELREFADQYQPGIGATLTFHCRTLRNAAREHRQEPHLLEIRQCIEDDGAQGAPGSPIHCATVNRRDQGCGREFRIAERQR
jgi:ribonuclease I